MEAIKRIPSVAESMTQEQVDEMYDIISKEPMREIKWAELMAMSPEERKAWEDEGDFKECIIYRHFHSVSKKSKKSYERPAVAYSNNADVIDEVLVEVAEGISCTKWDDIDSLISSTKSELTKTRLRTIMHRKYHLEEAKAGCL